MKSGLLSPVEDFLSFKKLYIYTRTVEKILSWSFWRAKTVTE